MDARRIKVLIGANDLLIAGVQRLVIDQLQLLDREQYEVHLAVLMEFPGRETLDALIPPDVTVHRIKFSGFKDIGAWFRLIRVLKSVQPDVVKTATFFSNTVFLFLRPLFGYHVVAAEHNTVNAKPRWQRFVDRILLPKACTIVGDSQMVVEFVSTTERIPKSQFTVIYNGVDLDAINELETTRTKTRAQMRGTYGIPDSAFVFFTAARLVKQKDHALMIESFAKLADPDAYLVIAGAGTLKDALEQQTRDLGVAERVKLVGEHRDVYPFYAMSDAFLLTSRHEGFCIAAMEALAFGMPVISTRVAGVVEYLEDAVNGYFAERTPEDMAHKLRTVRTLPSDVRERLGKAGRETAARYSLERSGKEYNELLKRCAS